METTVERLENTTVRVVLSFDEREMKKAFGRAYSDLSSQVTIPGFRPGKAPRQLLDHMLGRDAARSQVMSELVPDAITGAVEAEDLFVVGEPKLEYDPPEPDRAFTVTATLTIMPSVEVGDVSGLELVKPVVRATEEEIDAALQQLVEQLATSVEVEGRAVQTGDFVYANCQVSVDGEPVYGPDDPEPLFFEVGAGYSMPAIDGDLIGMMVGESKELEVTYPEDYRDERLAGKKALMTVTIDRITERRKPELDEALFERVGVSDLQGLRDRIRRELEENANSDIDALMRSQAAAALANRCDVELPKEIIEARADDLEQELRETLEESGKTYEEYLASQGITAEADRAKRMKEAQEQTKRFLVLRAAAKEMGLETTDEELEEAVWSLARSANRTFTEMWEMLADGDVLEDMRSTRTREKVISRILELASIREIELTRREFEAGEWARGVPGLAFLFGDEDENEGEGEQVPVDESVEESTQAEAAVDADPEGAPAEPEAEASEVSAEEIDKEAE